MESMDYVYRRMEEKIKRALKRNKSVLILGARQTGKTTLINRLKSDLFISLVRPDIRLRYEKNPATLAGEVEGVLCDDKKSRPSIILDEVQKVPSLLDMVQDLIDRKKANFILTGSSARKLRRGRNVNLLPGRVVSFRLDPFVLKELEALSLEQHLLYGDLPGIAALDNDQDRQIDLNSYVTTYLEEEIRAEALVRNLGSFARFLELAATESGNIINLRKLSREIGIAHTTISSYFQILEDCLIAERISPITTSKTRKKLTKSQKYLFFDMGVRRLAAQEGIHLSKERMGMLLEQYIGLELLRCSRLSSRQIKLRFWRDPDGPEVDWVLEHEDGFVPIEVKWTSSPRKKDARHLRTFLSEYPQATTAYVICTTPRKMKLDERIFAIPWQTCDELVPD